LTQLFTAEATSITSLKKSLLQNIFSKSSAGENLTKTGEQLYKEINEEWTKLEKLKKVKREFSDSKPSKPSSVPDNWAWVMLGEVCIVTSGQHIMSANYNQNENGIPYLTGPADFGSRYPMTSKWTDAKKVTIAQENDVLLTVKGASVGKVNILNISQVAIGRQLKAITAILFDHNYLYNYLNFKSGDLKQLSSGVGIPGINRKHVLEFCLPMPSIREQREINAKVDNAERLIEDLIENLDEVRMGCNKLFKQILLKKLVEDLELKMTDVTSPFVFIEKNNLKIMSHDKKPKLKKSETDFQELKISDLKAKYSGEPFLFSNLLDHTGFNYESLQNNIYELLDVKPKSSPYLSLMFDTASKEIQLIVIG
jgi:hypothetical protein